MLAFSTLLACGSDEPPEAETDGTAESGTGASTGATTHDSTMGTTPSDDGSSGGSSGGTGPGVDTGSEGPGSDGSGGCPAGTEGCPCVEGIECDAGLVCSDAGSCELAPACRSVDAEPNDDEGSATMLMAVDCNNMFDLGVIGTIDGPETDWWQYFGAEGVILCSEEPQVTVSADIDLEVCVYVDCLEGNTTGVGCTGGSVAADSPEGRPGCCGTNAAHVSGYDCSGGILTPKNVYVYVSVATDQVVCIDYGMVEAF
ncbi:MAG: hypothetical protein H6712_31060 [Myxococcales bacterium]|nr:hypothetical protein [Myxococcales bacterium]MCB9718331.1 hypothetical protein [Myxococcales bacterium]